MPDISAPVTIDGSTQAVGLVRIELEVFVDNARAIALYEKRGFRYEGRLRKARLIDGDYRDVFHMALLHPTVRGPVDE